MHKHPLQSDSQLSIMREMAKRVINVATVPHRSPFRYPGGKTWLVPYVRQWLKSRETKPTDFIEPFAGGGIVSLSVLFEGLCDHITLIERDEEVAAVWKAMLSQGKQLAKLIMSFELTTENVTAHLTTNYDAVLDRAFQTIIRNRVQRGGILAPGAGILKEGENGRGIASRWYPETLSKRINDIVAKASAITFIEGNGLDYMSQNAGRANLLWFVDPPYTVAGRRLYRYSEIDHHGLFAAMSKVKADFLMTYDDAEPIRELARKFHFDFYKAPMKSTHHELKYELLIGRDLGWARKPLQFRKNAQLELLKAYGHSGG
jgi:DNA adenine methylase